MQDKSANTHYSIFSWAFFQSSCYYPQPMLKCFWNFEHGLGQHSWHSLSVLLIKGLKMKKKRALHFVYRDFFLSRQSLLYSAYLWRLNSGLGINMSFTCTNIFAARKAFFYFFFLIVIRYCCLSKITIVDCGLMCIVSRLLCLSKENLHKGKFISLTFPFTSPVIIDAYSISSTSSFSSF